MKKLLLFALLVHFLSISCSKDDDNALDSDCGAIISLDKTRTDGGIRETVSMVVCGDDWKSLSGTNWQGAALAFSKGAVRASAAYLVATKSDTIYIRYEGGNVPQPTIDSFVNVGYTTRVDNLTGLEHIKWPE